jgi:hypothetical protein
VNFNLIKTKVATKTNSYGRVCNKEEEDCVANHAHRSEYEVKTNVHMILQVFKSAIEAYTVNSSNTFL